jgi:hypothetical protein
MKTISSLTSLTCLDISVFEIEIDITISQYLGKLVNLMSLSIDTRFEFDDTFINQLPKLNMREYNKLSKKKK